MHTLTRSSAAKGSRGPSRSTFTPKGLSVSRRRRRISSRSTGGGFPLNDMMPRPPALLTAAASSGPAIMPSGAPRMGTSMPSSSQSRVRSMAPDIPRAGRRADGALRQFRRSWLSPARGTRPRCGARRARSKSVTPSEMWSNILIPNPACPFSGVGFPQALAEVVSPTPGKRRERDGATEKSLVLGIARVEVHDVRHGDAVLLSGGEFDGVARRDGPLARDREIEPGAPGAKEPFHDVGTIESDAELEARH